MSRIAKVFRVAASLGCVTTGCLAAEESGTNFSDQQSYWLSDPQSGCYVFYIGPEVADTVTWSGDCANGAAGGAGTATFTNDGRLVESLSGWFRRGKAEGGIRAKWADGSRFEGHAAGGRFNGKGVFITADGDRLEGQWSNNRLKVPAVQAAKDESKSAKKVAAADPAATVPDKPAENKDVANKIAPEKPAKAETKVAAAVPSKKAHNDAPAVAPTRLFDALAGKKLVSLDGSTISLTVSDGALIREIASPGEASQKTRFSFLNEKQGTVSDAKDAKVIGLFRATESKLEIDYADGHSETLVPNSSGGVSILLGAPGQGSLCMSWYPEGHQFSTADRQLALALYASRLGLPAPLPVKAAAPSAGCATAEAAATPTPAPVSTSTDAHQGPATSKPASATAHALHAHRSALKTAQPNKNALSVRQVAGPVVVRPLRAHRIDADKPMPPSVLRSARARRIDAEKPLAIIARPSPVHRVDVDKPGPAKVELATARTISSIAPPPAPQRASTCLNVESDGADWGFRNHCSFPVQFAYCLMDGGEVFASCQKGAVTGSVPPNGFNRLLAERATNAGQHDFRWIACNGDASHVVARLVKPNPPAGQCIPARAS
jgi:hypothetical protein